MEWGGNLPGGPAGARATLRSATTSAARPRAAAPPARAGAPSGPQPDDLGHLDGPTLDPAGSTDPTPRPDLPVRDDSAAGSPEEPTSMSPTPSDLDGVPGPGAHDDPLGDLEDLFGTDTFDDEAQAAAPTPATAEPPAGGLDDLFDFEAPASQAAPPAAPWGEAPGPVAVAPPTNDPAATTPGTSTTPTGAPAWPAAVAAHPGSGAQAAAVDEVWAADPHHPEDRERWQGFAERIRGLIAQTPGLGTRITASFELTRDHHKDREQRYQLEEMLRPHLPSLGLPLVPQEIGVVLDMVYDELIGLGPLGVLWRDDDVTEILVDGWDKIYVERNGRLLMTDLRFRNEEHANTLARAMAEVVSRRALSKTLPLVNAQLDGARVNFAYGRAIVPEAALAISLRKFKPLMGMDSLVAGGSLTPEMRAFLHDAVVARATALISGGTGVGKTTLINALSESIPSNERVITIEDSRELQLRNRFVLNLQTKEAASSDDDLIIDQEQLLVNTLRMRPDRIVVGEIRDPKAATVMLQAAMTGHDGTMTTIHASNPDQALNSRLAGMIRSGNDVPDDVAKRDITEAFDLVVQGRRLSRHRFVSHIAEISPRALRDGRIVPNILFTGDLDEEGRPRFTRVGALDPEGTLALKMAEAGIDLARWT